MHGYTTLRIRRLHSRFLVTRYKVSRMLHKRFDFLFDFRINLVNTINQATRRVRDSAGFAKYSLTASGAKRTRHHPTRIR